MGILTTLYRIDKTVFEGFQGESRLKFMIDELIGLSDAPATFAYDPLSVDKSWHDFASIFKKLLPNQKFGMRDKGAHTIEYRDMDVVYWDSADSVWVLSAVADVATREGVISSAELDDAFQILKTKIAERSAQLPVWKNEWGDVFNTAELDYVYSHITRTIRFLVNIIESGSESVIVRVSN